LIANLNIKILVYAPIKIQSLTGYILP